MRSPPNVTVIKRRLTEVIMAEAYCVKCKEKREMKDVTEVTTKNGRPMLKGTCPVCSGKLNLFIKK
jgi:DNA polymerase II large subunit